MTLMAEKGLTGLNVSTTVDIGTDGDSEAKASPAERVRELLGKHVIKLLSAKWLLDQPEGFVIQRRQDLLDQAFIDGEQASDLFDYEPENIVVLSYGWLSKVHPDPFGFHMATTRRYLRKHMERWAMDDVGVFWDFAALPQDAPDGTKKTEEEKQIFAAGLKAINLFYGAEGTFVIQLTSMPEESEVSGTELNLRAYNDRGWCFFEATASGIVKKTKYLLDLGHAVEQLEADDTEWEAVKDAACAERKPPLTPEAMTVELQARTFTNGKSDCDLVARIYSEFFLEVATTAGKLQFDNPTAADGWGNAEIESLANALPAFSQCEVVELRRQRKFGDEGLASLAAALVKMPFFYKLRLDGCTGFGEPGLAALRAKLPELNEREECGHITLSLPEQFKGTAEGQAIQALLGVGDAELWITAT